ncbi:metallophosphoesterase [Candidatus Gracilibacteria bacterium]|nr:metallophosphoesterase [Candidatus Gracilibacteria bacterium]
MIGYFLIAAVSLVFLHAFLIERFWIKVRRVELGLPFRVLVASDWHLGLFKGRRFLRRAVAVIEKEKADLILMPGDFVYLMRRNGLGVFSELRQVGAPIFGVLGNHDLMEFSKEEMTAALGAVRLVDNRCEVVSLGGEKVAICGVGDLMMKDDRYEGVMAAMDLRRRGEVSRVLVLMHNPDGVRKMVLECGVEVAQLVDLVVCGHTHGGQLRMPRWLRRFAVPCEEDFVSGIYEVCGVRVLVSAGLGETLLPLRLGVRPEVVILEGGW